MASLKPKAANGKLLLEKFTSEIFLKNIVESRIAQGESIENFSFDKTRCRVLTECEKVKDDSSGVLYWMSRDCRVQDNWAMLYAQRLALKNSLPLFVCFLCKDSHYLYPTKRQFSFLLEGLKVVEKECNELNIKFLLLNSTPIELAKVIKSNKIGGIVCDFSPLKKPVEWQELLKKNLPKDVPLVQVDAHNVVPVWEASPKQEVMAKTIRPKINTKLPDYLTGFPSVCKHKYKGNFKTDLELSNTDEAFSSYKPNYEVEEIKWAEPGPKAGFEMLYSFLLKRLQFYGVNSNDPTKNTTSNLSPWLHFGHISAQRCALEVKSMESLHKSQVEKYLEELIVRKELAENYCFYNENYDNINGAAEWAKKTLIDHKTDKRIWIYSRNQLEKAETHDEMWNAAQLQLVQEGKIHGYLRMYWCKKILEWSESPEKAIEYGLWLNDTFSIDGTDPNGFVGVMWSICCVHDQGWKEREIFGKIRYMVDYSLRRKFDMDAFCARFGRKLPKITAAKKGTKRKQP